MHPRASRDELGEPHGERLPIRITAAPVDSRANAHLIKFLAELFCVPKAMITLVSGATSRDKRIRIHAPRRLPPGIASPAQADTVAYAKRTQ